jgi:UDP-glucose 4-epimerase
MPSDSFTASTDPALQRPRVLVTGGTGRVAHAIRDELGAAWQVTSCSREAMDDMLASDDILSGKGSMGFEAVVHCAWSCVPANAGSRFGAAASEDLASLRRWVERLSSDPAPPLFVFMSSGAVYGPAPGRPSVESDEPQPQGAYAEAKLAAERMLLQSALPVCLLRVAPLYGLPEGRQKLQGVISHLLAAALRNQSFDQWGEDSVKDYLHRSDFCEALRRIVAQRLQGDVWNVGSGVATHLRELVRIVEKTTGHQLEINLQPSPEWDVRDNRLDITKLRGAIDWQPGVSIERGIELESVRLRERFSQLLQRPA